MAENERMSSIQLHGVIDNILEDTSKDMVEHHDNVLKEFQKHLQELDDAKFKLESHLKKVIQLNQNRKRKLFPFKFNWFSNKEFLYIK